MIEDGRHQLVDECQRLARLFVEEYAPTVWAIEHGDVVDAGILAGVYGTLQTLVDEGYITEEMKALIVGG